MGKTLDQSEIITKLVNIAKENVCSEVHAEGTTTLEDLGYDSLEATQYQLLVEDEFDVDIENLTIRKNPNSNLWYLNTSFSEIAKYIHERL